MAIGRRRWAIAEGYIPSESSFEARELISHETACILNAGDREAHVAITIVERFAGVDRSRIDGEAGVLQRKPLVLFREPQLVPYQVNEVGRVFPIVDGEGGIEADGRRRTYAGAVPQPRGTCPTT